MINWEYEYNKLRKWTLERLYLNHPCYYCFVDDNHCAGCIYNPQDMLPKLEGDKEVTDGVEV